MMIVQVVEKVGMIVQVIGKVGCNFKLNISMKSTSSLQGTC